MPYYKDVNRVLAIIPARGGSKGIPGKNLVPLCGKPLVQWSIDVAKKAKSVRDIVLTSDSREILEVGCHQGVRLLLRDPKLAQDDTSTEAVIKDVIDKHITDFDPDCLVLLQPTSPIREPKHIDEAVDMLMRENLDSVVSVVESHSLLWRMNGYKAIPRAMYDIANRQRRQDMGSQYEENGSIYVFTIDHWEAMGNRLGGKVGLYRMPGQTKIQVDSLSDLDLVRHIAGK
jgi:CMP-N,N'-diacetyllegionaminic acid synthase